MKRVLLGAVLLASAGLCAGVEAAQFESGSSEAGLVLGAAVPLTKTDLSDLGGKDETALKTGLDVGGRYLYHTSSQWAFGGEVSYAGLGDKTHSLTGARIKESASAADVEAVAKYTLETAGNVRPYFIGGLGYGSVAQKTRTKPVDGYTWLDTGTDEYRTNYDESLGGVALSLGAGIESFVSDNMLVGIEARWKHLGTSKTITDDLIGAKWDIKGSNSILVTAGVSYKFGK